MREDTNDFEDQNDEFSFEAGPMQMEAVNVNGQEDPLAATGFIPLSPELPALSNMSRWYQDEVSTRLFLDGDNQDIALMEKQCLRGGLPLGSYLKSGSVKEKSSIYQKTYLVVAYMKSKSGVPNVKANHRVRSFGASMRFHGTLGLGKTMQESNFHEAAFAFGCGAMERLWMSSNTEKSSVGLIADLFVSNQFRRQNVGSRVIQDLEGKMKRVGATIIFSRVPKRNREAMTLFNKHGFVRMIDIQITLWKTSQTINVDSEVNRVDTESPEFVNSFTKHFKGISFLPSEKVLGKVFFNEKFHGGTFSLTSEDKKSFAQISVFKHYEMYISKRVRSGGIFARLLSCINPRSRKSDFELTSILFAPICFGPEGTQLLKFVARAAFNRCVDTGATLVAIATAGGNEIATGLSVEELLSNVVIELQMEFSMLGKPIAEQLPKLTRDSIFIDPRW